MRTSFINALLAAAEKDPDIWLVNADLGFSVLEPFAERFPERYLNVGVAEQNMIGVAAGLATTGAKVFVYSIANFPTQRCLEQIRVDVCYHQLHVVVVAVGGGFAYGSQGYTHHAIEDLAVMRSLPGMRVGAPGDPHETTALVDHLASVAGPGYLRLGRDGEPKLHDGELSEPPLTPIILREGGDVALLSTGGILAETIDAADRLAAEGIKARVVSVPMLKPLAEDDLMRAIEGVGLVATVEEHSLIGGLRDAVAPLIAGSKGRPVLVANGVEDGATRGVILSQKAMRAHCSIDAGSIAARVRSALAENA